MSQRGTPYVHQMSVGPTPVDRNDNMNKRPNVDSTITVSEKEAKNAKQLLNVYIYDFLLKSRLPESARSFAKEADLAFSSKSEPSPMSESSPNGSGDNSYTSEGDFYNPSLDGNNSRQTQQRVNHFRKKYNLPKVDMSANTGDGFLYEWWQIFRDVYQATNRKGTSSENILEYCKIQQLRRNQINHALNQSQNFQGHLPFELQTQKGQYQPIRIKNMQEGPQPYPVENLQGFANTSVLPYSMRTQPMQANALAQQQHAIQTGQAQQTGDYQNPYVAQIIRKQQQMAMMSPGEHQQQMFNDSNSMNIQQSLYMSQMTQQQQQQHSHNKTQEAQNQMNNLRQQAAVVSQYPSHQKHVSHPNIGDESSASSPAAKINTQGGPISQQTWSPGNPVSYSAKAQMLMNGNVNQPQGQANHVKGSGMLPMSKVPIMKASSHGNDLDSSTVNGPNFNPNTQSNRNLYALQDYQIQLMMLEKQNKRRFDIANNKGTPEVSNPSHSNPTTAPAFQSQSSHPFHMYQHPQIPPQPPQAVRQAQFQSNPQFSHKNSPVNVSSPVIANKSSPSVAKGRKELSKRSRNSSASSLANQAAQGGTIANSNSNAATINFRKDVSTPLTPTETPQEIRRKRKESNNMPSPNFQVKQAHVKKEDPIFQEKPETFGDNIYDIDLQRGNPVQDYISFPNEQMIQTDVLGGVQKGEDVGTNGSVMNAFDDLELNSNQFLNINDDVGLHDNFIPFNWGNVDTVESRE